MPEKRRHALHAPVEVSARGPHSPIVFGRVGARAESFWQLLPAAGSSCSGGSSPGPFFLIWWTAGPTTLQIRTC